MRIDVLLPPMFTIAVGLGSLQMRDLISAEFSSSKARRFNPAPCIIRWYLAVSSLGTAARKTSTVGGLIELTASFGMSMIDQSRTTSFRGTGMYLRASNDNALARSSSDK